MNYGILSGEEVDEAEDKWTDACEMYGSNSPQAKAAHQEYQDIHSRYMEQMDDEPDWDAIDDDGY